MNTRMRRAGVAVALAGWLCLAAGQNIDLNGHVTDQTGLGIAGATVALLGKNLWVTTAADGSFHIDWSSPVVVDLRRTGISAPRLAAGVLHFSVTQGPAAVRVDVFDAAGRLKATPLRERLAPGAYQVAPFSAGTANQVYVVRLQVGAAVTVLKSLPGRSSRVVSTRSPLAAAAMAKSTAGEVDWLAVSKPGYAPKTVGIMTYTDTLTVQLQTRTRISFSVNRGASTVTVRPCTLLVVDSTQAIAGLRFTQVANRYYYKGSARAFVSTFDLLRMTAADSAAMTAAGLWSPASRTLNTGVYKGATPLFDSADADNTVRTATPASVTTALAWVLAAGGEGKRVFAEIAWTDTAKRNDTIYTDVAIRPWKVNPILRNTKVTFYPNVDVSLERRDGPDSATMIYTHYEGSQGLSATDEYIFNRPSVEFCLDVGADSTFADTFEAWLVTVRRRADLWYGGSIDPASWLLETGRQQESLTGVGAGHDTAHVYAYSWDPAALEGAANLAQIRCVGQSGSTTELYPFVAYVDTLQSTPDSQFAVLRDLWRTSVAVGGAKEFALVLKLKGRFFGEDRYYFSYVPVGEPYPLPSAPAFARTVRRYMYMDFWPPRATTSFDPADPGCIHNGDTVGTQFSFALDAASAVDGGNARITEITLVVARTPAPGTVLPSGQVWTPAVWDYWTWTGDTVPPVTLEDMLSLPHETYPYPIATPWRCLNGVRWDNISTVGWRSGDYLIGIVTSDEFGNRGLAPMFFQGATYSTNPFLVTVLSGS